MFHFGTRTIALLVERAIGDVELFTAVGFAVDPPSLALPFILLFLLFIGVGFVAVDFLLFSMQKIIEYL